MQTASSLKPTASVGSFTDSCEPHPSLLRCFLPAWLFLGPAGLADPVPTATLPTLVGTASQDKAMENYETLGTIGEGCASPGMTNAASLGCCRASEKKIARRRELHISPHAMFKSAR